MEIIFTYFKVTFMLIVQLFILCLFDIFYVLHIFIFCRLTVQFIINLA